MSRVTWFDVLFMGALVLMVVLPAKFDPAIRLKEWLNKKDETND